MVQMAVQVQLWNGSHSGALVELYADASQRELKLRLVRLSHSWDHVCGL
jgi:hypothetical protein